MDEHAFGAALVSQSLKHSTKARHHVSSGTGLLGQLFRLVRFTSGGLTERRHPRVDLGQRDGGTQLLDGFARESEGRRGRLRRLRLQSHGVADFCQCQQRAGVLGRALPSSS